MGDFFETVAALRRNGERFAVATVVGRRAPVSAHLGDRAVIFADGRMEGFVGGACSREIVRKQALESMRTRHARLVSIRPDAVSGAEPDPEHVVVSMTCASEGAVDVYVEPFLAPRRLVVVGATPVAEAVARVARSIDYEVVRVVDTAELRDVQPSAEALGVSVAALEDLDTVLKRAGSDATAVVASQGHYDEQALEVILRCGVAYAGLVASKKRGDTVRALLESSGVPGVAAVRHPAGLDLGARTPSEVALSIVAEIVQLAPAQVAKADAAPAPAASAQATAIDPVCGMDVEMAGARHSAVVDGTTYYFCCAQCRASFVGDPQAYLSARP